ncbi:hypothetical protein CJF42_05435 [Pseudoalteromonas sp. NBT06-2]|uniref:DNA alkylation repair protein n=1 Tax=Pseudoalteromonas sp. NBT06-2 TaxID=2025950 RepID=UPI000BA77AD6|nr:DNA alkylation repair protein [Pseudoalteromonas sp. NBT06-2]PAJ75414.1 hypothetical protein CJF42_05435 [Pseudoalteromonas sp. NBT06-2]
MKNNLSEHAVNRIAHALSKSISDFDTQLFQTQALSGLLSLELKERVIHIINVMHTFLPLDFKETAKILLLVKNNWDYGDSNDSYSSFAAWPIIDYVSIFGIEYKKESLELLKQLTGLFSSEFAIRAFIVKYPDYCLLKFKDWIYDKDEHVRRLVSEGTRPRLPWGMQIKAFILDPSSNLPLLTKLKSDPSLYVRRSVANHLNDIAKDNPDIVINLCKQWQKNKMNKQEQWVIKHATRSLVKAGHKDVFTLLGYTTDPKIKIEKFNLTCDKIKQGGQLHFDLLLHSTSRNKQNIVIDYAIHFVKANGKTKPKVFKLKTFKIDINANIELSKKHSFKAISTRKYYIGAHKLEILVNGQSIETKSFDLI